MSAQVAAAAALQGSLQAACSSKPLKFDMSRYTKPDVASFFNCAVCLDVSNDPCELKCGHIFCVACVQAALQRTNFCPTCKTIVLGAEQPLSPALKLIYRSLDVFCQYAQDGCVSAIPPECVHEHESKCPKRSVMCPNRPFGCQTGPSEAMLAEHVKTCQFRQVTCVFCYQKCTADALEGHQKSCAPTCECGRKIARQDWDVHQKTCGDAFVLCPFSNLTGHGCDEIIRRKEIEKHLGEQVGKHLLLVTKHITQLTKENADLKAEILALEKKGAKTNSKGESVTETSAATTEETETTPGPHDASSTLDTLAQTAENTPSAISNPSSDTESSGESEENEKNDTTSDSEMFPRFCSLCRCLLTAQGTCSCESYKAAVRERDKVLNVSTRPRQPIRAHRRLVRANNPCTPTFSTPANRESTLTFGANANPFTAATNSSGSANSTSTGGRMTTSNEETWIFGTYPVVDGHPCPSSPNNNNSAQPEANVPVSSAANVHSGTDVSYAEAHGNVNTTVPIDQPSGMRPVWRFRQSPTVFNTRFATGTFTFTGGNTTNMFTDNANMNTNMDAPVTVRHLQTAIAQLLQPVAATTTQATPLGD